jgi:hypothetical protein
LPANVGKGVPVEKKERRPTVKRAQQIEGLPEGQLLCLRRFPFLAARCLSFRIKAVLRASSLARSKVEADDKLPTPVFEKSGSDL